MQKTESDLALSVLSQEDTDCLAEADESERQLHFIPQRSMVPLVALLLERDLDALEPLPDGYRFPWGELTKPVTQATLAEVLEETVTKIESGEGYYRHRVRYCVLSVAMNQLGMQAPAFRHQPKIPAKAKDQTPEHMLIQRDRVVIDCHWLYATKSKVYATEGAWRGMVNPKLSLQRERIERFATTLLRNDSRADEVLELTRFQQLQMAALRGAEVQATFRALREGVVDASGARMPARFRRITRAIQEWADSQPRFEKLYPKYRAYALAIELLGTPTHAQLAELAGLILGEQPLGLTAAAQTRSKLETLISGV